MKKHILFIVENNCYPGDIRVHAEANEMVNSGYEVSVISPTCRLWPRRRETVDGVEVYRHFSPRDSNKKGAILFEYLNALFWELVLSIKILIKKRIHYLHGASPPDLIFIIALLLRIFGVQYVFDHHDLSPEMYVTKFKKKDIFYRLLLWMEKLTFNCAKIVISTNESYKRVAVERGGKKERNVFVVRNGPALDKIRFSPPDDQIKKGFDYLIVYLGVIGIQERLDILLDAVSHIINKKKIHNMLFLIVGAGPHLQSVIELSRRMHLEKYVTFTGYVSDERLSEIMSTADICVDPEFKDDFSDKSTMLKTLYYMAFGRPIVQFDKIESRYTAGAASLYIETNDHKKFADQMVELCADKEKRAQMGAYGQHKIRTELCWDIQKKKLLQAYDYLSSG